MKARSSSGASDAPKSRQSRLGSRLMAIALLGFAIVLLARLAGPQTIGETARRHLQAELQDHYREFSVSIRRGHYDPDVGLIFEDLRISDPSPSTSARGRGEMVRVERLTVVADVRPENLIDGKLPLRTRRILLDGVHANAWLENNGQLSLEGLLPLPSLGPTVPRIDLKKVRVRLVNEAPNSRPIDAELDEVVLLSAAKQGGKADTTTTIRGSTDFANDLLVQIDSRGGATDVRCAVKGAYLTRNLFDRLPSEWAEKIRDARDLECVCDATFALHQSADGKRNYQLKTTVHDGRFAHLKLPKPITQLRGVFSADPSGISIDASQGRLGDALVRLTGRIDGHAMPCNINLNLTARGLLLDDRLAASLPDSFKRGWERLQPLGRVDVDTTVTHRNLKWNSEATVTCKGVDIRYEKFPYPVESLVGKIEIRDGIATASSLNGRIGGNRMQCAFRVPIQPGLAIDKSFIVATDGPIPIDNTLLNSLSPRGAPRSKLEDFVRSLGPPRGSVQLASAILTTDKQGNHSRKIDLRIINGYLRYERFSYPLYNVNGTIEIEDDWVKLVGFRAANANAGSILCDGSYRMAAKPPSTPGAARARQAVTEHRPSELSLNFRASNVPMDHSLRSSLPPSTQQAWDSISPSGILDELNVLIGQRGAGNPLTLNVTARQHDQEAVTNRTLSLRPTALPYRIDVIGGAVHYDGKQVTIESIRGKHDASQLSANGRCVRDSRGRWELLLDFHSGCRLHPDDELIAALPTQMRRAMRQLRLRGPVNVRGQTLLTLPDAANPEPRFEWDIVLQLEGNRIADVGPVHSLRGELSVQGVRDEYGIRAGGDVRIDSMHVYNLQIVGIRGPFSVDGDRMQLGGETTKRTIRPASTASVPQKAPPIRGRIFDGVIDLNGEVILSSGSFDVGLTVADAQVPTLLADFGYSDNELTGTFSGQTQLQGILGNTDALRGTGAATVSGANMYQLPLIVQLLNLLRITPTEDHAFTDGAVEFTLFGETMTFTDLQLWGDLVALHGGGTLDRRRELALTFNTRVSPQNTFTQILAPLRSRRYTLWTVDVRGPLHSPDIELRSFEGVGETLDWLFPGMIDRTSSRPETETRNR